MKVSTQQVAQLVERPIEVVEYLRHTCQCLQCGRETQAAWPERVIPGQDLDAHLQGFLGWLGNYAHISYDKQAELVWELGQISVGEGTLATTNARVATAVTQPVNELQQWVKKQSHVHLDETPWAVKGIKEWLWVAANKLFCLFHAGDTRSRAEIEKILGERFEGIISSDDLSVYNGYPCSGQQKCLAHLRRHVQKLIKFGRGVQQTIGEALLKLIDEAFRQYRHRLETKDISQYQNWAEGFKLRISQAVKQYLPLAGYVREARRRLAGKLLRSLRNKFEQWWYFLDHPEVPPDHNLAERALRLAVTKRKVSGGSRSMERFAQTATLLSVAQTCRFQGRSVSRFFREALMATAGEGLPYPKPNSANPNLTGTPLTEVGL